MKVYKAAYAAIATAAVASPCWALDVSQVLAQPLNQPQAVEPSALEYESYYGGASPADEMPEPTPLYSEPAAVAPAHSAVPVSEAPCEPVAEAAPVACAPVEPAPTRCCCPAPASCCNLGEAFTLSEYLLGPCRTWDFGMWTQIGYHSQQTPLSNNFADGLAFNDVPNQLNLHQQWFWFEKVADGSAGLDWGFRFDIMYGTDAQKTQAFGNDNAVWDAGQGFDYGEYGWAMPQAYLELATGDWSVLMGHFYTLVGYEVVTAPDNFFYSHAYTMFNSEPFTHTGVIGTYSGYENFEVYTGWTAGWDTGFDQYTQNGTAGSNFLGGFSANLTDNVAFTYICTFGDFGQRSDGATYDNAGARDTSAYSHSMVFDVAVSDQLNYVFQSDLVSVGNGVGHDQVGINQYLFYTLNDCWAVGSRLEWWRNDSQDFHEITFGLNYRPHANVVFRPEVRYDWTPRDGGFGESPDGSGRFRDEEATFGIDMVLTY
ncbi:MAG: outer membrane beta-barrel protein [Planctomycetota bacterium]